MIRKIAAITIVIILILFIKSRLETISELKNNGNAVEKTKEQLTDEKNTNALLKEQLKYVQTNEFIEHEARERLNLTKKGEILVVHLGTHESIENAPEPVKEVEIWKKWINRFF